MTPRSFVGRVAFLAIFALAVLFALTGPADWLHRIVSWRVDQRAAIEFFRREPLSFLVTERIVTQVVVEKHAGNILLGAKDGYLFGAVELLYGIDLAGLDPQAIRKERDAIRVAVPAPTLLRAVPDLDSVRFLQKRTPMIAIADKVFGEDLYTACLLELDDAAARFVETNDLAPTRAQLVGRLNEYAPVIAAKIGATVVFE